MSQIPTQPVGPLDPLVKAALAPPDKARDAWNEWRRGYAIDETPWNEVRLLGAVFRRIDWLEPNADILPRVRGIQKFPQTARGPGEAAKVLDAWLSRLERPAQ